MSWASRSGHGRIAGKKTICGEGDGLQRSVGDLGFSRRRYDLTPLRWGKCFGLIVAIDAGDLKFPANS